MVGCISAFLVSGAGFGQHLFIVMAAVMSWHCAPEICMIRKQSATRAVGMQH